MRKTEETKKMQDRANTFEKVLADTEKKQMRKKGMITKKVFSIPRCKTILKYKCVLNVFPAQPL